MTTVRATPQLGPMPVGLPMHTVDEAFVRAPLPLVFDIVRDVERWPALLPHYRWVRYHEQTAEGSGIVEMAANRPFGQLNWPTWWLSEMQVISGAEPAVRFRHIGGITRGMEVEWAFAVRDGGTFVRLVHSWEGPRWPLVGAVAVTTAIGAVVGHGIGARTLAGWGRVAEREARQEVDE